ncbi:semaphorin-4E-like isoform X2 [Rhinatrema bivittatum]|uniref:semaphorin-4E-like isoform X2 n=1 Tax=Rhinatrema bivittatum TaxID=194408 RepID=UPI0011279089|nr:semaphorin-4E-like isoform X2 [Rhinatrema bivittatum]
MNRTSAAVFLFLISGLSQQIEATIPNCIPRKTISFQNGNIKVFVKPGFANFSTLLLIDESETLLIGAREAIFSVDLNDISREIAREYWPVSEERQMECTQRGKNKETECRNYILLLHNLNNTMFYVCGTNAFHPTCDYLTLNSTGIHLEGKPKESRGKCPFEPTLKYSSLLVDGELYSATSYNFLGSEPILLRTLGNRPYLRTEFKTSWLNEPSFIHMDIVRESENNPTGDDDKIYVFFSETAIEFEFYDKLLVSRIGRVCKGDLGGRRILQKKWTSFLKATLICSVPEANFLFNVVQDVFLLKMEDWRDTVFYGVFTQQWGKLDISAVCTFSMERVQEVFSRGKYKGPVTVEHSHVKWVMYSGEIPSPRPGACINKVAQRNGYRSSLDLPDKTLQFVKDHPLMDDSINPIGNRPVLLRRGSNYTRIVVDRVIGIDNRTYDVMFLGTDNGYLHKALNCDGEMFIVEEIQLFQHPEPVQSLKLSSKKGLLYVGSPSQVVQLPVAACGQYTNCFDCILARDPYCAWSHTFQNCVKVADEHADSQNFSQSVKSGDASVCPQIGNHVRNRSFVPGNSIQLPCSPVSNLASTKWIFNGRSLQFKDSKYLLYEQGMVIFNVTLADRGYYDCQSLESANGKEFCVIVTSYALHPRRENLIIIPRHYVTKDPETRAFNVNVTPLIESSMPQQNPSSTNVEFLLKITVGLLTFLLLSLLIWDIRQGNIPFLKCDKKSQAVIRTPATERPCASCCKSADRQLGPCSFSKPINIIQLPNNNNNNNSGWKQ